jgi:outer membrane protein assembly factor BamB/ABC-type phosphate/phosphonate transport system substrate-binding protein
MRTTFLLAVVLAALCRPAAADEPLVMVVMDPLAAPLACPCVEGHAQRDYDKLARFLAKRLDRPVKAVFSDDLGKILRTKTNVDLIVGKRTVVEADAKENRLPIRPLAMLTGKDGATTLTGLIVVRSGDAAKRLSDLKGYRVLFGPAESVEKHGAAVAALREAGVEVPEKPEVRGGCSDAALEILEEKNLDKKMAAVISSYAMPLLEGCHTIEKGSLRLVGRTKPVPFVAAFATDRVGEELGKRVRAALLAVAEDAALLKVLESKKGFVAMPADSPAHGVSPAGSQTDWPGWRGAGRDAIVAWLPEKLSASPNILWTKPLASLAPAGLAATEQVVIVADRSADDANDVFLCFDAATGFQQWRIEYPAPGNLDYGNGPRATSLVHGGKVYLLGAFGDLRCVNLIDGAVVWKKNIVREYRAKLPTWGMCASPLVVDGRLIVNPGGAKASLVALDPATGKELWRSPGSPAAYASFIEGRFGGVRQIVGYDSVSLGGWDIKTGKRLWTLVPPQTGDFNVPTPIALGGKLLVSSENNGTRLYEFDAGGTIRQRPVAVQSDLAPDAGTPVAIDGRVFGCRGDLFCLDTASLKTQWTFSDKAFDDYVSFIAGSGRVLAATVRGELLLLADDGARCRVISRMKVFDGGDMYSHPALVGDRLYLRGPDRVYCVSLK